MDDATLAAWLTLLNSGLSHAVVRRIVDACQGPREAVAASDRELETLAGLSSDQCARLRNSAQDTQLIRRQTEAFHRTGMRLLTRLDADYPENLRRVADPPPCLFLRGELREEDRLAVAIVGSRMATPYGLEVTRRLCVELAPLATITSGLALGIDTAAHERALDSGGRTIGVAPCGLDLDYPRGTLDLRDRILKSGALLSPFPPGEVCGKGCFPRRNYILAGLSVAVIVVEATETSGSLLTAASAVEEGREVLAVPGEITRPASRGANRLLQQGAALIADPADIAKILEGPFVAELERLRQLHDRADSASAKPSRARSAKRREPSAPRRKPENLSPAETALYDALHPGPQPHDELLARFVPASFTVGDVSAALLQLEMKGLIQTLPGRMYEVKG